MFVIRCARTLLVAATLLASATVASAQLKVAVINVQKAVLETAEIKKAQTELEAKFKPRQDQMERLQRELQTLQGQLQAMQGKLTPAAEQDMVGQGQRKQRELQRLTEDLQADVDRERQDILGRSSVRMQEVVKKLSEAGNYDVVVDVSTAYYFKPALDITKDATAAYDKTYPVK
jgi:outer membrane protein